MNVMISRNQVGEIVVFIIVFLLIKSEVFSFNNFTFNSENLITNVNVGLIGFGLRIIWKRDLISIAFDDVNYCLARAY
jgi:hypothetical protein